MSQIEKTTSKEQLQKYVERASLIGLDDITDEEFEAHKKYTVRTALNLILNKRKGIDKIRERENWKAIILGGRDNVWRGVKLEDAKVKSQYVSVLIRDENDDVSLSEVTQWGHLKTANNGDGCELSVEVKETELQDGSLRTNKTIRDVTVKKKLAIQTYEDIIGSGLNIFTPEEVDDDYLYDVIAVEGVINNVDTQPVWGDPDEDGNSIIEGQQPIWFNEQPCLRLSLKSGGSTSVRVNLKPTKHALAMTPWPEEFVEICKSGELQETLAAFVGMRILAIGCVKNFNETAEMNYAELDATAILIPDDPFTDLEDVEEGADEESEEAPAEEDEKPEPEKEEPPAPEKEDPAPEEEPAKEEEVEKAPAPAPKKTTKKAAKVDETPDPPAEEKEEEPKSLSENLNMIEQAVANVKDLMDTLDTDDLSQEDIINAKVLPDNIANSEALVTAVIKKAKKERT